MTSQRPVYLNLLQIRLPCPGLVSILHRASGVIVFLLLPVLLCLLSASLNEASFSQIQTYSAKLGLRFLLWLVLSALAYHLVAGVRHLLMDIGIGESLRTGRFSACLTLVIATVFVVLLGIWLW